MFKIDRHIEVAGRNTAAGRTAGLCSFKLFAVWNAAANFLDYLPQCCSHRHFDESNVCDIAAKGEYLRAFGRLRTHR
jgi:hypothetical protein